MAALIPKQQIDDIRFRSDVVDVIGNVLTLKKTGGTYKALCPFHKEKSPSFVVNPQRQIFHCFGCGVGGDVIAFIMQYEGVDFMTAIRMLAERAGIQLESEPGATREDRSEKEELFRVHREVAAFYQRCLMRIAGAESARDYLKARGLWDEAAETFGLGYAPNRWDSMLQWGARHKAPPALLERAGLVLRRDADDPSAGHYDRFRHRLMFPIADLQGRIIGFSARALSKDERAKYINSPETPLFRKSRVLYALDRARPSLVETREAIVCEGQIDVIRCHAAGFTSAVAAQGTAFTDEHAQLLKRYADRAVLVFDSDHAGQDAAVKTAGVLIAAALAVRVARLPTGEDPDSFIVGQGAEAFRAILDNAEPVIDFQLGIWAEREDLSTDAGAMRAARAVLETISQSPNAVQQARLLQAAAERLNLPIGALEAERRRLPRARAPQTDARQKPAHTTPPVEYALCEHLVRAVLTADASPDARSAMELVQSYCPARLFSDPQCRALVEAALSSPAEQAPLASSLNTAEAHASGLQTLAAAMLAAPGKVRADDVHTADAVRDLILRLWRDQLLRERETLARAADSDPESSRKLSQLTMDINSLKTWATGEDVIALLL